MPSGATVGTENWSSSHGPAAPPPAWKVQSAGFEPEISCGAVHVIPPSSLWVSAIGDAVVVPLTEWNAVHVR